MLLLLWLIISKDGNKSLGGRSSPALLETRVESSGQLWIDPDMTVVATVIAVASDRALWRQKEESSMLVLGVEVVCPNRSAAANSVSFCIWRFDAGFGVAIMMFSMGARGYSKNLFKRHRIHDFE
jgi:hypothetical protein